MVYKPYDIKRTVRMTACCSTACAIIAHGSIVYNAVAKIMHNAVKCAYNALYRLRM